MPSEEFYVQRVLEAKVINTGSRNKPKKDRFEWKWEPEENFTGAKWALKTFWRRVDSKLGGRDYKDLRKFKVDERINLPRERGPVSKQKPGPGRSSAGLIKGTRVFALWPPTQHYYSAVVQRRIAHSEQYVVQWDEDNSSFALPLKHMRPCAELREEDTIILKSDVVQITRINPDGTFMVNERLDIGDIIISAWNVEDEWEDRKLAHEDIACAEDG
ncbi:hypothetical protein B0H17DRAFT_1144932 [Mycena rosella]|uniref:DNA repair protein Crb2 Tudor domain-containing protein n=1 Tax=Mycena rosella TaxID=1033263 RepID=A0AAD7CS50_MYCRO|nr:hypothetical protein B0H17DRAFT_1144932 [Mycena rosella]